MESSPLWQIGPVAEGDVHTRFIEPLERRVQQYADSQKGIGAT
jgi:hypothetical protein